MAVEKLAHSEFQKIGSRQEALQTIFPSLLDIFYHPIFDSFQKNRVFQQPQDFSTVIRTELFRRDCRSGFRSHDYQGVRLLRSINNTALQVWLRDCDDDVPTVFHKSDPSIIVMTRSADRLKGDVNFEIWTVPTDELAVQSR